ncbi:hypothetical protein H920_02510 [Fukomys damarensis]|uniref:Uncharacterized protein n=1 Tax=Fukomys damarensis TaxID=885580 RepID=A0A091EKQ8_FUKDA|nr:hypothetical protein H920_02510 [Fukomys damarensis]
MELFEGRAKTQENDALLVKTWLQPLEVPVSSKISRISWSTTSGFTTCDISCTFHVMKPLDPAHLSVMKRQLHGPRIMIPRVCLKGVGVNTTASHRLRARVLSSSSKTTRTVCVRSLSVTSLPEQRFTF